MTMRSGAYSYEESIQTAAEVGRIDRCVQAIHVDAAATSRRRIGLTRKDRWTESEGQSGWLAGWLAVV